MFAIPGLLTQAVIRAGIASVAGVPSVRSQTIDATCADKTLQSTIKSFCDVRDTSPVYHQPEKFRRFSHTNQSQTIDGTWLEHGCHTGTLA